MPQLLCCRTFLLGLGCLPDDGRRPGLGFLRPDFLVGPGVVAQRGREIAAAGPFPGGNGLFADPNLQ